MELIDCFYVQLDGNQEENRRNVEKLEKRVTQLEADLESESELFEERVGTVKTQNAELRNHLNLTIDTLNNVIRFLNSLFTNKGQSDETDQTHSPDEESRLKLDII